MSLVSFDSNILICIFQDPDVDSGKIPPETIEYQKRAKILAHNLENSDAKIVVPTPAVAEYLSGIGTKHHGSLVILFQELFFHIPTFDLRASAKAAELWQAHKSIPHAEKMGRRFLKMDVMIIACAVVSGVQIFYSHDAKCRRLATMAGMTAKDLPTHSEDLFVDAELRTGKKL